MLSVSFSELRRRAILGAIKARNIPTSSSSADDVSNNSVAFADSGGSGRRGMLRSSDRVRPKSQEIGVKFLK